MPRLRPFLLAALALPAVALPAVLGAQRPLRLYAAPAPAPQPPHHPHYPHRPHRPVLVVPVWWGPQWGWGWQGEAYGYDGWQRPQRPDTVRRGARPAQVTPGADPDTLLRRLQSTPGVRAPDPLLPWQVDERATLADSASAPAYPVELANRRITGRVVAQFVVDAAGRPVPATLRIMLSTDRAFSESVRAWLPTTRWTPARKGGHPVTAIVEETFAFQ